MKNLKHIFLQILGCQKLWKRFSREGKLWVKAWFGREVAMEMMGKWYPVDMQCRGVIGFASLAKGKNFLGESFWWATKRIKRKNLLSYAPL